MSRKDKIFDWFFTNIMPDPYYRSSDGDMWVVARIHIEFHRRKWELRLYHKGERVIKYKI